MAKVVVFGVGQNAEIAHYYLTKDSPHEVVAFTVDRDYLTETSFHGLPVVPFEELEQHFPPGEYHFFAPLSFKAVNEVRAQKYLEGKKRGYRFITYISSHARCETEAIGENCFILENNVIQPFVTIGDNVILWSGNHIGHHTVIESHCFLASHVVVSGAVRVGEKSFIGVNATLRDNIEIGASSVIGAAAVVLKSTPERAVLKSQATEVAKITSDRLRGI